jgi:DNA cross-link repair 1A protein
LVKEYFLTHFHADHYGGLLKSFSHGTIYCSPETARLVKLRLKVDDKYIREIPLYTPTEVLDSATGKVVTVTLVSANHCPGSAMLVFCFPDGGATHLHTGDFRFHSKLRTDPVLSLLALHALHAAPTQPTEPTCPTLRAAASGGGGGGGGGGDGGGYGFMEGRRVDTLFLDTTYCAPQHDFPLQIEAVRFVADLVPLSLPLFLSHTHTHTHTHKSY